MARRLVSNHSLQLSRTDRTRDRCMDILVADSYSMARQGLASYLQRNPSYNIVGQAGDGKSALDLSFRFNPDIVIMDNNFPDIDSLQVANQLMKKTPQSKIILYSDQDALNYILMAVKAGVLGYLIKGKSDSEIDAAIFKVSRGEGYLSRYLTADLSHDIFQKDQIEIPPQQQKVLYHITDGKCTKEIALLMKLSTKTIEYHRYKLMKNLNLRSQVDLAKWAVKYGFYDLSTWKKAMPAREPVRQLNQDNLSSLVKYNGNGENGENGRHKLSAHDFLRWNGNPLKLTIDVIKSEKELDRLYNLLADAIEETGYNPRKAANRLGISLDKLAAVSVNTGFGEVLRKYDGLQGKKFDSHMRRRFSDLNEDIIDVEIVE